MKKIVMILLATFALGTFSSFANAGRCDHYWQTAKDGSACEIVPLIVAQADNKKKKSLHLSYLQLSNENKLGGEINKIIYSKID